MRRCSLTTKQYPKKTGAAIQKMLLAGHDIVLSTGRPVESGRAVARELELTQPGCYMIAFNGAVLYDCAADRVLLKRSLPIEVTQELFERAAKAGIYAQTYNNTEIITTRHTAELEYYRKKTGLSYKLSANVLDLLEEEPQKVLMIDLKKYGVSRAVPARRIWNGKRENVPAFFSCREYLEYCPLDTSKGTGVSCLTKMLNLPSDCTVAVEMRRMILQCLMRRISG